MPPEIDFLDSAGAALRAYRQEAGSALQQHLEDMIRNIAGEVFALLLPEQPIPRDMSADYLQRYLGVIEEKIATICRAHSWYLMLFLSRRAPIDELRFSLQTHIIATEVLTLACIKYGHQDIASDFETMSTGDERFPGVSRARSLPGKDLRATFELRRLALEHACCAGLLRSVWKGGRLVLTRDQHLKIIPNSDEIRKLTALYDQRHAGGRFSGLVTSPIATRPVPFTALAVVPSVDPSHTNGLPSDGPMNFVSTPISLEETYSILADLHSTDPETFIASVGTVPKELIAFLLAISRKEMAFLSIDVRARWQINYTGYVSFVGDRESSDLRLWFRDAFNDCFGESPGRKKVNDAIDRCIEVFTYHDRDFTETMLWDRSPLRVGFYVGEQLFWDFSAVPAVLDSLLHPLAERTGKIGGRKGHVFAESVARYLRACGFDIWKIGYPVRTTSSSELEGDIDVAVIKNGVLFAIECKAKVRSLAYDRGEGDAVHQRTAFWGDVVEKHIAFCAKKLRSHPRKLRIPSGISHVAAICCSPFKEYYPATLDHRYFLDEGVPIVATDEEIGEFLRTFSIEKHIGKPYLSEIDWASGK